MKKNSSSVPLNSIKLYVKSVSSQLQTFITGFRDHTVVEGLLEELQKHCACGGRTAERNNGTAIVLVGDHLERAGTYLTRKGYFVAGIPEIYVTVEPIKVTRRQNPCSSSTGNKLNVTSFTKALTKVSGLRRNCHGLLKELLKHCACGGFTAQQNSKTVVVLQGDQLNIASTYLANKGFCVVRNLDTFVVCINVEHIDVTRRKNLCANTKTMKANVTCCTKILTYVNGLQHYPHPLHKILSKMKMEFGCGGFAVEPTLILQGDQTTRVSQFLSEFHIFTGKKIEVRVVAWQ